MVDGENITMVFEYRRGSPVDNGDSTRDLRGRPALSEQGAWGATPPPPSRRKKKAESKLCVAKWP